MEMEQRKKGYLLILLAAVVYSTTEVALKELAGAFAPMQLTAERVLLGGAVLLPFALRELKARGVKLTASDFRYFIGMGALTVMLHMSLLQMSLLTEDASYLRSFSRTFSCTSRCAAAALRRLRWRCSAFSSFSTRLSWRCRFPAFWRS